jgi:hypothetical protein
MVPTLLQGHCLDWIPKLKPASVDLILADLPYGKSRQSHHQHISTLDEMIPLDQMWECFRHVIKPAGCIVMTATEPFASMLVVSILDWCRYDMIWSKAPSGYLNARRQPTNASSSANCSFLSKWKNGKRTYNPQMRPGKPY